MGGFFPQPVCVQLLEKAVEILFRDGYDEESDAVEQPVTLLKAWPRLSEWELAHRVNDRVTARRFTPASKDASIDPQVNSPLRKKP